MCFNKEYNFYVSLLLLWLLNIILLKQTFKKNTLRVISKKMEETGQILFSYDKNTYCSDHSQHECLGNTKLLESQFSRTICFSQLITNQHCEPGFQIKIYQYKYILFPYHLRRIYPLYPEECYLMNIFSEADTTWGTGTASWDPDDQGMAS